ncbi:MAG: L,D-transpeptidase family protein [Aquificaceae bacterium]|nr:L,D-transpeptidase family protein [Aquificaceae bacterium]MDW8097535.1 L,D-transpeptidase family protein [Aquificaceae bacterium]
MAVALYLFLLFLYSDSLHALEKGIRENWHKLSHPHKVYELYRLLGFKCVWFCQGAPTEHLRSFQEVLKEVVHHGLNPQDYLPREGLEPELAYTDALLKLSYDLYYGRLEPSKVYKNWNLPKKPDRVLQTLHALLREHRLTELLRELSPRSSDYWFLVEQAKTLRELSHVEWKPIRETRRDETGPCLQEVAYRLFLLGDLEEYRGADLSTWELQEALKRFQQRHGLPVSGQLDKKTLGELNVSPAQRLQQVYLNLEKHRWLSTEHKKAVVVNIPSFELFYLERGVPLLHSKVIVGRNYRTDFRPTPVLYSKIESISLNPKWYVPLSISTKDILPKVQKDPNYLKRRGFKVFYMGEEVDPLQVDWSSYSQKNFPFLLVQEAGQRNSLGRIKFNFPNPFAVYLHDTPDKHLFNHTKRAFSSGCIRVEKAKELALRLLGEGWDQKRLDNLIKTGQTQSIKLNEAVPVYLLYFTAFERDGRLHFREDLYGYDTILSRLVSSGGGR